MVLELGHTMKEVTIKPKIVLTDEEKKRLVAYFNVLIEMDFELKRNEGVKKDVQSKNQENGKFYSQSK